MRRLASRRSLRRRRGPRRTAGAQRDTLAAWGQPARVDPGDELRLLALELGGAEDVGVRAGGCGARGAVLVPPGVEAGEVLSCGVRPSARAAANRLVDLAE